MSGLLGAGRPVDIMQCRHDNHDICNCPGCAAGFVAGGVLAADPGGAVLVPGPAALPGQGGRAGGGVQGEGGGGQGPQEAGAEGGEGSYPYRASSNDSPAQVWSLLSSASLVRVELPAWLDQHTRSAILSYLGPSPATQTCPLTGAS